LEDETPAHPTLACVEEELQFAYGKRLAWLTIMRKLSLPIVSAMNLGEYWWDHARGQSKQNIYLVKSNQL